MTRTAVVPQTARVLVVNDGVSRHTDLAPLLSSSGYRVTHVRTGQEALDTLELRPPDVMIVDLQLPDMEGSEVCRLVRQRFDMPIIVLSARGIDADKIAALDEGADDYVTLPLIPGDLLARVRLAVRRIVGPSEKRRTLRLPGLTIDFKTCRVIRDGHDIDVNAHEFELLAYFARHANRVLTYRTILLANPAVHTASHLWERIGRLRQKIEVDPFRPRYLVSEPWVGYRFVAD